MDHRLITQTAAEGVPLPADAYQPARMLNRLMEYLTSAVVSVLTEAAVFTGLFVLH